MIQVFWIDKSKSQSENLTCNQAFLLPFFVLEARGSFFPFARLPTLSPKRERLIADSIVSCFLRGFLSKNRALNFA